MAATNDSGLLKEGQLSVLGLGLGFIDDSRQSRPCPLSTTKTYVRISLGAAVQTCRAVLAQSECGAWSIAGQCRGRDTSNERHDTNTYSDVYAWVRALEFPLDYTEISHEIVHSYRKNNIREMPER